MFNVIHLFHKALLCVLLLVSFGSTCIAQRVDPPQDSQRYYLTVFTSDNWKNNAIESRLMRNLDEEPLAKLKRNCHFNHYTTSNPVYVAGRFWNIKTSDFPVIVVSKPNGGYFYKASNTNIPSTAQAIFDEAKAAFSRDKEAQAEDPVIVDDPALLAQDCPDGMVCPTPEENSGRRPLFPNAPWNNTGMDTIEGIFGGGSPIRDSLASVGWVIGSVIILFFLSIAFFGFVLMALMALYVFIKR
jgi:hypothetical protein